MTQSTDLPELGGSVTLLPGVSTVTLEWTDYTTKLGPDDELLPPQEYSSGYELLGSELHRTYDGTTSIVGRNITSVAITWDTRVAEDGRVINVVNVVITATKGDVSPRSETLEFSVYLRGEGLPQ